MLTCLGRFVPYHLMGVYNMTEVTRDRYFAKIPEQWSRLATCHRFRYEQDPVFSYKSSELAREQTSGYWVVEITDRVVRVCAGLLVTAYVEYRLWYLPPDIVTFARRLGMAMEAPLGSPANVREVLELLSVLEETRFDLLPTSWRRRPARTYDHHPGREGEGADFVYYDPWLRRKISEATAVVRAAAVRVIPDDLTPGWVHLEEDAERTQRDTSVDYVPGGPPYYGAGGYMLLPSDPGPAGTGDVAVGGVGCGGPSAGGGGGSWSTRNGRTGRFNIVFAG